MAIITKSSGSNSTETFKHSIVTGTFAQGVGIGIQTYFGDSTFTYDREVKSAEIIDGSATVISISGKGVKYRVTSGTSNTLVYFSVKVTFIDSIEISDIITTSDRPINYVKRKSTGKFLWTRPTNISLQLPWKAVRTWSLSRTAALNPDIVSVKTLSSNSTLSTSGTTSYTISGAYCGDTVKLTYTLKPGYNSIGISNSSTYTVDPGITISTTTSTSSGEMPKPTIEITSPVGWDAAWDDIKNNGNCADINVKVTVPSGMEHLAFNVSAHLYDAECYYRKDLKWTTYKDTGADIYSNGTKISSSSKSYTALGTINANSSPTTFTLQVKQNEDSDENAVSWPKYAALYIMIKPVAEGVHGYTTSYSVGYGTGGTYETGGAGGGAGGYTGGFGGGYGGWMPS